MSGKPGTGKSHIAKAIAYNTTLQGMKVHYVECDTVFAGYAVDTHTDQDRLLKSCSSRTWSCSVRESRQSGEKQTTSSIARRKWPFAISKENVHSDYI
ncbi:ATP-binding protein [Cupriavidus necator]